jgi:microcystin-dependent protein
MKYRENESEPWKELYIKALDSMPIGMIVDFVGTDIPNGWLICDGSTLDEETYPELYDALGGSGSTFTLPDCKGRVLVGYDANDTDFNAIGKTGGSKELQSHSHELQTSAGANYAGMVSTAYSGDTGWAVTSDAGTKSGGNVLSGTTRTTGQGNSGNLQPYYVAYKIIKAKNTTPTMASIVNTKNNSTTDGYSCDYVNNALEGTTLYEDATGTSGNITLSDTLANYNKINIQMKQQDDSLYWIETLLNPNGKNLWITKQQVDVSRSRYYLFDKRYSLSGTSINKTSASLYSSNNNEYSSYDNIRIIKVIGYK